jgi:hypothetical protein
MKTLVRASLLALSLVLAMSATALAATTRIPFSSTTTLIDVPDPGVERFEGNTWHVDKMVLVYDQVSDNPMVAGPVTVTVSFVFGGGQGNAMWGTELIEPTAYPGEGFTCTMSGGWDRNGVMQANDRCTGFGTHLAGWQYRSHITAETQVEGYLVRPGD